MIAEKVEKLEQENTVLKKQVQELLDICESRIELPKNCEYCSNFMQHYIKNGGVYYPTHGGHCIVGNRIKDRKVSDTCKAYAKRVYRRNYI